MSAGAERQPVCKAGPQGSEPPCGNFLGVAAASSEDLREPWRVITAPIEDAFLWRDERGHY